MWDSLRSDMQTAAGLNSGASKKKDAFTCRMVSREKFLEQTPWIMQWCLAGGAECETIGQIEGWM